MDLQAQARSIQQINTKNNRVEALFQHRLRDFDRLKNQTLNNIEQCRLETRDFLKQVRSCHSDKDPLSIKLLGRHRRSHHSPGIRPVNTFASTPISQIQAVNRVPPPLTAPHNGLAPEHTPNNATLSVNNNRPITQPGKMAVSDDNQTVRFRQFFVTDQTRSRAPGPATASERLDALPVSRHRSHRRRTPIGDRMQHFFERVDHTKRTPGTRVVDSRESDAYRRSMTLSKNEWHERRRQWDPLFAEETDSDSSESNFGDGSFATSPDLKEDE